MSQNDAQLAAPLTPEHLPPAIIEPLSDAQIAPVTVDEGFAHGIYRADGSFCEISRTRISDSRFTNSSHLPDPDSLKRLEGTYLFCGLGRHHFGHFLMETASRLWALEGREGHYDGLIILTPPKIDFAAVLRRRMKVFFDMMGCTMPIHIVSRPMEVEQLHVPAQGFGHLQWAVGTEAFRRFVRTRVAHACRPMGPEKIYVSRSKLKHVFQHVDQEERIEKLMISAGYTVFHPERHNMYQQCQVYRAAHTIVGGDGSAFHLAPFAMMPKTRVGLIQRRARLAPVNAIAHQIEAFADVDLTRLNPLLRQPDGKLPSVGRREPQPIAFDALVEQLEQAGLI